MKKRAPGCLGDLLGDELLPSYVVIIMNYYDDPVIPIKQPV